MYNLDEHDIVLTNLEREANPCLSYQAENSNYFLQDLNRQLIGTYWYFFGKFLSQASIIAFSFKIIINEKDTVLKIFFFFFFDKQGQCS